MPSADQVPVKNTHSRMRWHMWVDADENHFLYDGLDFFNMEKVLE